VSESKPSGARTTPKPLRVLVTGVTGHQGGAVAGHLLARGHRVRGFTRDGANPRLEELRAKGVEVATGTFDEPATLEKAASGVDAMFLMGTPQGGAETEAREGIAGVDAAKRAGVPWLVYSSVASANRKTGIPHFESKFAVEEHLERSGVPHAVSAPTAFFDNYTSPYQLPSIRQGKIAAATSPDRRVQMVAVDNIGAFVTLLLENPSRFAGVRVDIASDDVSGTEAARVLSELTGRTIAFQPIPLEALRAQNPEYAKMYEFFERVGYRADIEGLRRDYPEVRWLRFREWAATQDWARLLA
jgi:uncharacterized protein YbjT (DUF2867 family)